MSAARVRPVEEANPMGEVTVLLSIEPSENRFRFFVIELRTLRDGSAELHRRWGRIGTEGRHEVEAFSTLVLAQSARRELLERRRRRGYRRAEVGVLGGEGLAPAVGWQMRLACALDAMRRETARRREALVRKHESSSSRQLALPLPATPCLP